MLLDQEGGENSIIIVGGANQTGWAISDADRALLRSAGAVLLQREIPEEINAEVRAGCGDLATAHAVERLHA